MDRNHRIGELTEDEADQEAGKVFEASAEVKRGGDRGSNQHWAWEAKPKSDIASSQSSRAEFNGVHRDTQRKLDRLDKDRPDLLAMVRFSQISVNKAAYDKIQIATFLST